MRDVLVRSRRVALAALVVASMVGPLASGAAGSALAEHGQAAAIAPAENEGLAQTGSAGDGAAPAGASQPVAPLLGNLGSHRHQISTGSELAQRYFDEGLNLTYGFNHAEAIRAFRDALALDPACAMCYWGIAYALGPNINAPMADAAVPEAWAALQAAQARASGASPAEQAYIQALAARYAPTPVADRAPLDRAFADAMRAVAQQYPDDLDAATIFAEALMDLMPWGYWTLDGQPTQYTAEILATLERVMARNPNHPGATHFYIHAVEASQTPERAVPAAERLETLVPGAGHLVHMPGHTYWRVGRYQDAVRVNLDAIRSDETYFRVGGVADLPSHGRYVFGYYPHNIHFVFAGAQMSGQSALALEAARKLVGHLPDEVVREARPLEGFLPLPLFALARFGRWDDVLREPRPSAEFPYATGMWHWARGRALVAQDQLDAAQAEADQLAALVAASALQGPRSEAATLLRLAANVLDGELAGARGQTAEQIAHLEGAIAIQDALPYSEPPPWYYPVRQDLGAVLLRQGQAAAAEAVYREDLRQYPHNGWSLFGLAQSLRAQGRSAEAAAAQAQYEAAWQQADVALARSRF
jgi:tetratricopeptide (TPR) repeat protein